MTQFNRDLLIRVRDYIKDHPDEHDQNDWGKYHQQQLAEFGCRTTYCIAGHVCVTLSGDIPVWGGAEFNSEEPIYMNQVRALDGTKHWVPDRALELLGLTDGEADDLFFCSDDSVLRVIDDILNSHPE